MYATAPASIFTVFCNPGTGGEEALAEWYMEIHGPDALANGSFDALHRYRALGDYEARFLAVWEGNYTTLQAASDYITPRAEGLRHSGRVTEDMTVTWAAVQFRRDPAPTAADRAAPGAVGTLTLVWGAEPAAPPPGAVSRYGDFTLVEQTDPPAVAVPRWAGVGDAGMAPHAPYTGVFRPAAQPLAAAPAVTGTWVSHWEPIGSLTSGR
jgi:hypothetical protein